MQAHMTVTVNESGEVAISFDKKTIDMDQFSLKLTAGEKVTIGLTTFRDAVVFAIQQDGKVNLV